MDAALLGVLKQNIDHVVAIETSNNEHLVAKLLWVSEEDQDIIYDLISSNRPYEQGTKAAYLMPWEFIVSVSPVTPESEKN